MFVMGGDIVVRRVFVLFFWCAVRMLHWRATFRVPRLSHGAKRRAMRKGIFTLPRLNVNKRFLPTAYAIACRRKLPVSKRELARLTGRLSIATLQPLFLRAQCQNDVPLLLGDRLHG